MSRNALVLLVAHLLFAGCLRAEEVSAGAFSALQKQDPAEYYRDQADDYRFRLRMLAAVYDAYREKLNGASWNQPPNETSDSR